MVEAVIETNEQNLIIDASVHSLLWLVTCPVVHCGFCPYQTILELGNDEVRRTDKALCGDNESVRSYSHLGGIEVSHFCCLSCVDSNLGTLIPGNGCDHTQAEFIARALKDRVTKQKVLAHTRLSEEIPERMIAIEEKLEAISNYIDFSPSPLSMDDR